MTKTEVRKRISNINDRLRELNCNILLITIRELHKGKILSTKNAFYMSKIMGVEKDKDGCIYSAKVLRKELGNDYYNSLKTLGILLTMAYGQYESKDKNSIEIKSLTSQLPELESFL